MCTLNDAIYFLQTGDVGALLVYHIGDLAKDRRPDKHDEALPETFKVADFVWRMSNTDNLRRNPEKRHLPGRGIVCLTQVRLDDHRYSYRAHIRQRPTESVLREVIKETKDGYQRAQRR